MNYSWEILRFFKLKYRDKFLELSISSMQINVHLFSEQFETYNYALRKSIFCQNNFGENLHLPTSGNTNETPQSSQVDNNCIIKLKSKLPKLSVF